MILVGNKCDMEDERVVSVERGKHLAEQLGEWRSILFMLDIKAPYDGHEKYLPPVDSLIIY